jgi:hypothetical protein
MAAQPVGRSANQVRPTTSIVGVSAATYEADRHCPDWHPRVTVTLDHQYL